jgi:hypothetical protein
METPRPKLVGIFVIVVTLFALAQLLYFTHQQGQITQCQADVNQQFLTTIKERAAINDGDRDTVRNLVAALVSHPNDQAAAIQAINTYDTENKKLDQERAKFQYPELNKC